MMYLGLDIGTSSVKAILAGPTGKVVASQAVPLTASRPRPTWSEQAPDDWWAAVNAAVAGLPADLKAEVEGIGLAGQMHGAVLLDQDDRPLRPAILWNDGRSAAECRELEAACPVRRITGNAAMPGFTAPKLLWLRRHEPQIADAVRKVLLPKDYVRLCMTGDHATDMSDASGTLWLEVGRRAWSAQMLAACQLDETAMPALFEGTEVTGRLRATVADAWGMGRVPVVAGGGDNAAGAVGCGVIADGQALLSLGTSGVIFVANDRFSPAPDDGAHAFCHALPGRWHQMAVILSAAASLDWMARTLGHADPALAIAAAEASGMPFAGPEIFLPYLSGERTPHNDPLATGALLGLRHDSSPGALVRAVLEGVAFALADGLDVLEAAGRAVRLLHVTGGAARSPLWGRILASALNRPLSYGSDAHVGPAFGAARLARLGVAGADFASEGRMAAAPRLIEPEPELVRRAEQLRHRFRDLYPALKTADQQLGVLGHPNGSGSAQTARADLAPISAAATVND